MPYGKNFADLRLAETTPLAMLHVHHVWDARQRLRDPGCSGFSPRIRRNIKARFQTWRLLLLILAGWIIRQQQDAIEYLPTEIRILREKLGKNRILLSDDQRRHLAVKGKILG